MSDTVVLDASALLCLLGVLTRCVLGTVNLAEVASKLRERGLSRDEVGEVLGGLHLGVRPFSPRQALIVGDLRPETRAIGLSLGDRACLALAIELQAEVYTTDRALASAPVSVRVTDVRLMAAERTKGA